MDSQRERHPWMRAYSRRERLMMSAKDFGWELLLYFGRIAFLCVVLLPPTILFVWFLSR